MPRRWQNPITVQGVESDDGRLFSQFTFRDLPLAFRWDKEDDGAHRGAMSVGVMDKVWQQGDLWWGSGEYADTPEAKQAADLAEMGAQFLSADPGGKLEYHTDILDADNALVDPVKVEEAYQKMWEGTPDDAAKAMEWLGTLRERTTFDVYEVGGITQVDIPCWPQCRLSLINDAPQMNVSASTGGTITVDMHAIGDKTNLATQRARTLLRRLAAGPAKMHAPWFDAQPLTEWTKFTITDDGQMLGHIATWDACHRGYANACVRPAYQEYFNEFHTGEVALDDDSRLRCGVITHHEGHALDANAYTRLLEDPAAQLGPVRLHADRFGIQACGGVWPDVDPTEVARTLGGYVSGDWRQVEGDYLLYGIAVVNTPGYPHYEEVDGKVQRMVASVPPHLAEPPTPLTAADAFFDAPPSVITAACACEASPEATEATGVAECDCGGTCGHCGGLTPAQLLALAQLDSALKVMGPRTPVG